MAREDWRRLWRVKRIVRRERTKALRSSLAFGSGVIEWGDFGEPRRDGSDVCHFVPVVLMLIRRDAAERG
jgi:hypothetical protein